MTGGPRLDRDARALVRYKYAVDTVNAQLPAQPTAARIAAAEVPGRWAVAACTRARRSGLDAHRGAVLDTELARRCATTSPVALKSDGRRGPALSPLLSRLEELRKVDAREVAVE